MASSNNNKFVMVLATTMILCCWSVTNAWMAVHNSHRLPLVKTAIAPLSIRSKQTLVVRNLYDDDHYMDSAESAKPLSLSVADIQRFTELKSRTVTMPILIMDAIVPGQRLSFQSGDPKFHKLIGHALKGHETNEIGIIGFNPHTGRPLNIGVTIDVNSDSVLYVNTQNPRSSSSSSRKQEAEIAISMRGKRRFEVVGEPWLDDTKSFYLARVDIIDQRQEEELSGELQQQARHLSARIPLLVQEWVQWVLKSNKATPAGMNQRLMDIGPMPPSHSLKELAIWVSALVNPIPTLGVCLEIRPAMLSCRNDHDRVVLASTALQSSIDHLSGKRRLF